MKVRLLSLAVLGVGGGLALAAAAGGGPATEQGANQRVRGNISIISEATGPEIRYFRAVLDAFERKNPGVNVKYTSAGRQLPQILSTAIQGGRPPDLALIPQPALVRQFVQRRALKPITFVRGTISRNWGPDWVKLGSVNGKLYSVYYKGANKSTVWYNVRLFRQAGVRSPKTFTQFLAAARTLRSSGARAYSIGGASGWTLTDLFENIYLKQAGPRLYDRLSTHQIKWTHPSVKAALRTMGRIFSDTNNIAGGTDGALQTDFDTSVSQAFADPPRAAMIIEADFVAGVITGSTKAKPRTDFNYFPFPSFKASTANAVLSGGDAVVMFKDNPAARALIRYFTTPEAAEIRIRAAGGFTSPNKRVRASAYRDALDRQIARALTTAKVVRFDLSDLQPAEFGATEGQGLWKLFQDFLRSPNNVDGIATQMERAAARAFRRR
jgi:ABC-type glycerol-3-phosphate transport system substrate-binding protein